MREAKRAVRRAKNEEWSNFRREMEADTQGGQKWFWSRLRSLGGRGRDEVFGRVKDEDGWIVGEGYLVVDRWKRYFMGLYTGEGEMEENSRRRKSWEKRWRRLRWMKW